jgi:hypothetical protein
MNKTVSFFLFYFFTVFSFVQLKGESVGNSSEITPIKRTKKDSPNLLEQNLLLQYWIYKQHKKLMICQKFARLK